MKLEVSILLLIILFIVVVCVIGFILTMRVTKEEDEHYNAKNSLPKLTKVYIILPIVIIIIIIIMLSSNSL